MCKEKFMFLKSSILRSPHAFSTRVGGVSTNEHTKSLNLAFGRGDEREIVLENLKILADAVGFKPENIVSRPQIHSDRVSLVGKLNCGEGYFKTENIPEGDGYITDERGVVLGIKTADCVPILFEAERDGEVVAVGAVHAGWKGTVAQIAPKCAFFLSEMYDVKPENIRAAIGPCIRMCCYEVGEDFLSAVSDALGREVAEKFVFRKGERLACDLVALNCFLLIHYGILPENIDVIGECTCCNPNKYFSHRYSKGHRGTMLNVIYIP